MRATEQLRQSWSGLKQESSAALTPGRVVVGGLLSGYFSGVLASSPQQPQMGGPLERGKGFSLLLALVQLGNTLLPHLLPTLPPAFRAGVAAGAGEAPQAAQPAQPEVTT